MFIKELTHIIANLNDEYSKNEWIIPQLIEKYVNNMTSFEAYQNIDNVLKLILEEKNAFAWTEIFSILFSLIRRSDTTEIPAIVMNNFGKIGTISKQKSNYDYNQFLELTSYYRINYEENYLNTIEDNTNFNFRITTMPTTRPADYYLSCLDDSVFIDFNADDNKLIKLIRISFDGYGCCNVDDKLIPLNIEDSSIFIKMFENNVIDQKKMAKIVKKTITDNIDQLWQDALEKYGFI